MQGNDKTKIEVHVGVKIRLHVQHIYKTRLEVHRSATAGTRQ